MTDRFDERLRITPCPSQSLLGLEIWGDRAVVGVRLGAALPASCRSADMGARRLLWWEPDVWIARTTLDDRATFETVLANALDGEGAMTDLSGAFVRLRVSGNLWRELLMIGAVFDAESAAFGPGSVAGTVIHHLPVRLDVVDPATLHVYVAPSYADDLLHHWTRSAARLLATV